MIHSNSGPCTYKTGIVPLSCNPDTCACFLILSILSFWSMWVFDLGKGLPPALAPWALSTWGLTWISVHGEHFPALIQLFWCWKKAYRCLHCHGVRALLPQHQAGSEATGGSPVQLLSWHRCSSPAGWLMAKYSFLWLQPSLPGAVGRDHLSIMIGFPISIPRRWHT